MFKLGITAVTGFVRFLQSRDCTISVLFAVLLVALLGLAGASYDFARAAQARAALQAAVDGAALAAGADSTTDSTMIQSIAQKYVDDNRPPPSLVTVGALTTVFSATDKTISATLTGRMPASLLRVVSDDALNITVSTKVKRAEPGPVELVLALDTTLSMRDSIGGTRKIDALFTAATNLTNIVMAWPDAKMGVVPFSQAMVVGVAYKDKDWVTPQPDYQQKTCPLIDPGVQVCTTTNVPCVVDGVTTTCPKKECTYTVPPTYGECYFVPKSWFGVIGSRRNFEARIDSPTNPKYPWSSDTATSSILELSAVKKTVTDRIRTLATNGETYIPNGILWAWNMLTPEEPLTLARSKSEMEALGGRKVIVLMTDGMNTRYPTYSTSGTPGGYGAITADAQRNAVNATTTQLCTGAKNDSIIIYTVAFGVSDPTTKAILQGCASDQSYYFDVSDAPALNAAFQEIGKSMQRLRIIR